MSRDIRFSVVTPSYNQARFIRRNLDSVREQNYPYVEHIVIDNCSNDGTVQILEEQEETQWVSEPDSGQSEAVNKAIDLSKNEWVVWLNSDDYLLPNALARAASFIQKNDDAKFFYSNITHVDEHGSVREQRYPNYSIGKLRHWWWGAVQLWQPGCIFHRSVYSSHGPLDPSLRYAMDFDFFLRAQDEVKFHYLDAALVAFRHHNDQKGHENEDAFIRERIQVSRRYWSDQGVVAKYAYRVVLYFVEGSLVFVEGLRECERGNTAAGRKLIRRGLARNPLGLFRPEHFGYWLRRLVGPERYYRWRNSKNIQ